MRWVRCLFSSFSLCQRIGRHSKCNCYKNHDTSTSLAAYKRQSLRLVTILSCGRYQYVDHPGCKVSDLSNLQTRSHNLFKRLCLIELLTIISKSNTSLESAVSTSCTCHRRFKMILCRKGSHQLYWFLVVLSLLFLSDLALALARAHVLAAHH